MKSIAVFCGSSKGYNGVYHEQARKLGRAIAASELRLIYGGGKVGLMGELADETLGAGGTVIGIIPAFLNVKEVAHDGLTDLITVDTMHQRKALIHEMSDGFVAMPGGFGTLDELFESLTWGQLGIHRKPVGLLDVNGFFSSLVDLLDRMVTEGFLKKENREMVLLDEDPGTLIERMQGYEPGTVPKWI
jgi:uncharacterized protein (TIGR00730 family)